MTPAGWEETPWSRPEFFAASSSLDFPDLFNCVSFQHYNLETDDVADYCRVFPLRPLHHWDFLLPLRYRTPSLTSQFPDLFLEKQ